MEFKPWYPADFGHALNNILSEDEVTRLLQKPGCEPRFVYGILMLPTVLKYFIDVDQHVNIERSITQATLFGYRLYRFADASTPVIAPSSDPKAAVEGLLIFGLNELQRNAIHELEAGLTRLVNVQVEICQKESGEASGLQSVRAVDAGTFSWEDSKEGLVPIKSTTWSLDDFLVGPFYEQIAGSQHKGLMDISGLLPRQSSNRPRSYTRHTGGLESIQEER